MIRTDTPPRWRARSKGSDIFTVITAKIRNEDIESEFVETFSDVHATLTQLSKLYILEGFTEESEALLSDYGRLIQEFEEDDEL